MDKILDMTPRWHWSCMSELHLILCNRNDYLLDSKKYFLLVLYPRKLYCS